MKPLNQITQLRIFSILLGLSLWIYSCVVQHPEVSNSGYNRYTTKDYTDLTIYYYDSISSIKTMVYHDHKELTIFGFYPNQKLHYMVHGRYIDQESDLEAESINEYNFFAVADGSSLLYNQTNYYYDSYYPNGVKKTELIGIKTDQYVCKYFQYHENGTIQKEMTFKHFSMDSLFTPIGTWIEFDSSGTVEKEYKAPSIYRPKEL